MVLKFAFGGKGVPAKLKKNWKRMSKMQRFDAVLNLTPSVALYGAKTGARTTVRTGILFMINNFLRHMRRVGGDVLGFA